jgi:hypothetical protein
VQYLHIGKTGFNVLGIAAGILTVSTALGSHGRGLRSVVSDTAQRVGGGDTLKSGSTLEENFEDS